MEQWSISGLTSRSKTATIGAAYLAQRQQHSGDKDAVIFPLLPGAQAPSAFPRQAPQSWGGTSSSFNAEGGAGSGFGYAFDGGILARSNFGLSGALTIST